MGVDYLDLCCWTAGVSIFQQLNRRPSIPEIQLLISRPPLLPKFTVKAGLKLPTQFGDECECMVGSYTLQGDFIELEKVRSYPPDEAGIQERRGRILQRFHGPTTPIRSEFSNQDASAPFPRDA